MLWLVREGMALESRLCTAARAGTRSASFREHFYTAEKAASLMLLGEWIARS